ncbi:MAG: hypothetical protein LBT05_15655 [Planctomycetaceae bacterium]|nr:hypothetical protein [Planctomycetaceae bacterium]
MFSIFFVAVLPAQEMTPQQFAEFLNKTATPPPVTPYDDLTTFDKADTDRDGFVNAEELQAYSVSVQRPVNTLRNENENSALSNAETTRTFHYKSPTAMLESVDGSKIYIVQYDSGDIAVLDAQTDQIVQTIPVGDFPTGAALNNDGNTLFVTFGGYNGQIAAVNAATGKIVNAANAGHTPMSPVVTPDGNTLFLCNRFNNEVAEYGLPDLKLKRTVKVVREPLAVSITNNGKYLFVLNSLPHQANCFPDNPTQPVYVAAEISVIDVAAGTSQRIALPNGSCNLRNVCFSPDGKYAFVTHLISHFWNGTDKLDFGQMNVNAMTVLNAETPESINTVLLDDPANGVANPCGIGVSRDGTQIFITASGTNELIVLDAKKLLQKLNGKGDLSNDLTFTAGMKRRIPINGKGARAILATGKNVYVALYYNDTVLKFDADNVAGNLADARVEPRVILLNGRFELSPQRIGEIAWNDASLCYQGWQSCTSCHPEARMTGMNWDLLHDGAGNPKNTKSMVRSFHTPPVMWLGDRFAVRQCTRTGFQFIMFTPPLSEPCESIDEYLETLPAVPSPYLVKGRLSEKALRGKIIFESAEVNCIRCHSGEHFTDKKMYNVQTQVSAYESRGRFDTPTLIEVWRTAPYMHDGRYETMKEVFTKGQHGITSPLSDSEMEDLVEYVLSL